jgi:flagellar FliL protein
MAKDDQTADGVEEEGGKKKLIIIGAAVVVAIIIGVAAFMMMGKGKDAGKPEAKAGAHGEAPEAKGEAKAEGAGAHGAPAGAAAAGATNMFPLETFIVNIYDGQELRYLKVRLEIEMVSPAVKADIDARLAPIRDAILVLLSTKTLQDVQEVAGKNQLKDEILSSINKHIPPGKISKVYFTDFVVQ